MVNLVNEAFSDQFWDVSGILIGKTDTVQMGLAEGPSPFAQRH